MESLKHTVIKSEKQYDKYCRAFHELDFSNKRKTKKVEEEIELLTLLIEKYDEENNIFDDPDPVKLLMSLMSDHNYLLILQKSWKLAPDWFPISPITKRDFPK